MPIKAILFDSGRVLNTPSTGHWYITPQFFNHVNKKLFMKDKEKVKAAFGLAGNYIKDQPLIKTVEEEYLHFHQYYKIFFNHLDYLGMTENQIEAIAKEIVYDPNKYTFYEDAKHLIPQLSKDYQLGVVSDAWPSLEGVFTNVDLRKYFDSFVISSILGITKPDSSMYQTALDELGVKPQEAIFIDDNPGNCDGAKALGIRSYVLCRDFKLYLYYKLTCKDHPVVRNLQGVIKDMKKLR